MANQWTGVIATQTVAFRGTSTVGILGANNTFPQSRSLENAVYGVSITGGISGSFAVLVRGRIGGVPYLIAGLTAIAAAGAFVLSPIGYSNTNGSVITLPLAPGVSVDAVNRIDRIVTPSDVLFQSGVATAGISANCTVVTTIGY